MGSSSFGNAATTGFAMPLNIEINRAGFGRVRAMVAPG
jgi:hypothetical protein